MEAIYQKDDLNLTLGLPGRDESNDKPCSSTLKNNNNKRCSSQMEKSCEEQKYSSTPVTKAQVVGWPPVRSFRKNIINEQTKSDMFVKVSMDGAPFLRKIDLKFYNKYMDLVKALENMFKCRIGVFEGPENALTYEDKDGDWMLVGDVPWDMFITSCKRLRIMKGSEAKGLGAL